MRHEKAKKINQNLRVRLGLKNSSSSSSNPPFAFDNIVHV